jgi:hypothetical protein
MDDSAVSESCLHGHAVVDEAWVVQSPRNVANTLLRHTVELSGYVVAMHTCQRTPNQVKKCYC